MTADNFWITIIEVFRALPCMRDMSVLGCNCPATDCFLCKGLGAARAGQHILQHSASGGLITSKLSAASWPNFQAHCHYVVAYSLKVAALVCRP